MPQRYLAILSVFEDSNGDEIMASFTSRYSVHEMELYESHPTDVHHPRLLTVALNLIECSGRSMYAD